MKVVTVVLVALVVVVITWVMGRQPEPTLVERPVNTSSIQTPAAQPSAAPTVTPAKTGLAEPVREFKSRITKKFFGTYITPQNSPVSPERFTGFHTGVDAEYTDMTTDVPVYAVANGQVVTSRTVSGYGGVMVIRHPINGQTLYGVYGHLRPPSLTRVGEAVTRGAQIAVLGTGYSSETDGERRHLHFALAKTNTLAGYVSVKAALSAWLDPLALY